MVETYCVIWLTTTSARRITTTYKTSFHTLQPTLEAIGKLLKPSAKPGRRSWCFALDLRGAMEMIQGPSLAMPWMDGILKSDGSYESWWSYLIFECSSCAAWPSFDFLMGSYSIMIWSLVTLGLAKNFGIAAQRNVSLNSREKKHHRVYI